MLVVRELVINTGTMTFDSDIEITKFMTSTPTGLKALTLLKETEDKGYAQERIFTREAPNVFRLKVTYLNEQDSTYVQDNINEPDAMLVVNALGWTFERFVSYVYN